MRGLVTCGGYNMHDVAGSAKPASAEQEHRYWYQYYFHTERGRAGLTENRRGIARLLWTLWSPNWSFDDATFEASAAAFDNPDFVEVVIHSYRVRYGYVAGDPALAAIEAELAAKPPIAVPAITLQGETRRHGAAGSLDRARETLHRAATSAAPFRWSATMCRRKRRARPRDAVMELAGHEIAETVAARHFTNRPIALTFRFVVNKLKGGDPVSHCHSPSHGKLDRRPFQGVRRLKSGV